MSFKNVNFKNVRADLKKKMRQDAQKTLTAEYVCKTQTECVLCKGHEYQ